MATCSTNYVCTPVWYDATNDSGAVVPGVDVIAHAAGPHAVDLNVTCIVKAGDVQFQIKNDLDEWFTPSEASHTVSTDSLVRLPRANMPDVRILATGTAVFSVQGVLR